jgi:hypothetical protein
MAETPRAERDARVYRARGAPGITIRSAGFIANIAEAVPQIQSSSGRAGATGARKRRELDGKRSSFGIRRMAGRAAGRPQGTSPGPPRPRAVSLRPTWTPRTPIATLREVRCVCH